MEAAYFILTGGLIVTYVKEKNQSGVITSIGMFVGSLIYTYFVKGHL
jgi:hypothetical protein